MKHYIEECREIKDWFNVIGESKDIWERISSEDLDEKKGELLVRIWKTKEKLKKPESDKNSKERRLGGRKEGEGAICDMWKKL